MACVTIYEVRYVNQVSQLDQTRWAKSQQVFLFEDTSWLHLASQQTGRANLTLASAAQASSK